MSGLAATHGQLFIRTHASARPSRDQTHFELVYGSLQFFKRSQNFFGAYDEAPSVSARIHNPDRSPFAIHSGNPAQTPTGIVEIVCDGMGDSWHSYGSY